MNKSFTLIEILIVIVVIGILSAFILVGISSITDSANIAKSKAFSDSLRSSLLINLVSEWKLDNSKTDGETADTSSILDTWGNSSALSINGAPIVRSGNNCISGNCLDFINATDYISLSNPSSIYNQIINNSAYTIEGWAYFRNLTTGVRAGPILKSYTSTDNSWFIFIYRNTDDGNNLIRSWVAYTNTSNVSGNLSVTTTIQTNKWYYFVTTVSLVGTTGTNKLYVNSVGLSPTSNSAVSKIYSRDAVEIPLYLSQWSGVNFKIDEVRFYNKVMPTSQIRQNYYLGLNKLLKNQNITSEEFNERISELKFNLVDNE